MVFKFGRASVERTAQPKNVIADNSAEINPLLKLHIPRIHGELIQISLASHVLTILQRLLSLAQTTPSSPSLIHRPYLPQ